MLIYFTLCPGECVYNTRETTVHIIIDFVDVTPCILDRSGGSVKCVKRRMYEMCPLLTPHS